MLLHEQPPNMAQNMGAPLCRGAALCWDAGSLQFRFGMGMSLCKTWWGELKKALGKLEWGEAVRTTVRPICDPHVYKCNICVGTSLLKQIFRSQEINLQKDFILGSWVFEAVVPLFYKNEEACWNCKLPCHPWNQIFKWRGNLFFFLEKMHSLGLFRYHFYSWQELFQGNEQKVEQHAASDCTFLNML